MSRFRTIEVSGAAPDTEGLVFITVKSPALRGRVDFSAFIPRGYENESNLPMVILLHGVYGSHWAWPFHGEAHLTTQRLIDEGTIAPCGLLMPSDGLWGDGSGYIDHEKQGFEQWIVNDLPACAIETFQCFSDSSPLFVAGLSMGGFGAMRLGAKYSNRFHGISGHSSITEFQQLAQFVEEPLEAYGEIEKEGENTLDWMIRHQDSLPPFRFDCGLQDSLLDNNRRLHKKLESHGIDHKYEEFEGGHSWDYWKTHLVDTLCFFSTRSQDGLNPARAKR